MSESLAVQPKETNFILPGMAEDVCKDLREIEDKLVVAGKQESLVRKRVEMQKTYDRALLSLASKWFGVSTAAVNFLTPERKKEMEEVILRKAQENEKQCSRLSKLNYDGLIAGSIFFMGIISGVIGGIFYGLGTGIDFCVGGFVVSSCLSVPLYFCLQFYKNKYSASEVVALLESKRFLDGDKE